MKTPSLLQMKPNMVVSPISSSRPSGPKKIKRHRSKTRGRWFFHIWPEMNKSWIIH